MPVSATSKEYAPGQFEANLRHQSDARMAADHAVLLKQIVKAAARANGFEASFMAKPYPDRAGSGLHIHLSLLNAQGNNVFDDGSEAGSSLLRHAIGGLQGLMADSCAVRAEPQFLSPFPADMFAPVNRRWGIQQPFGRLACRSARARRAASNIASRARTPIPIMRSRPCSPACIAALPPSAIQARRRRRMSRANPIVLPVTIDAALARLEQAPELTGYLGAETLSLYRETKRIEAQRLRRIIAPAEYDWYL